MKAIANFELTKYLIQSHPGSHNFYDTKELKPILYERPPHKEAKLEALFVETSEIWKQKKGEYNKIRYATLSSKGHLNLTTLEYEYAKRSVYSESYLGEEGKYMEIDHFYPKSLFPQRVVEWGNLMASNKKCNTTKGNIMWKQNQLLTLLKIILKNIYFYEIIDSSIEQKLGKGR